MYGVTRPLFHYFIKSILSYLGCALAFAVLLAGNADRVEAAPKKSTYLPIPILALPTEPNSSNLSVDAVQLAQILGLTENLKHIQDVRHQIDSIKAQNTDTKVPLELRQDLADAKIDALEAIEQTRLDIEFVSAEIEEEVAAAEELLHVYTSARNDRIDRLNAYGFRVNGVLWAVAEAFDIPTYKYPKYSIPSGTIGILAGLVPSAFSLYALRAPESRYQRLSYPNMLSKIFDYPTVPRIDYPASVWTYLNSRPTTESSKTRLDIIVDYWLHDSNIRSLSGRSKCPSLDTLTGAKQNNVTIPMLSDRLTMLRETRAVIMQMSRPLLELNMVMRGIKHF